MRARELVEKNVAQVPDFRPLWDSFLNEWKEEREPPWYIGMGELAHYIVEMYSSDRTADFPSLFSTIEALLEAVEPEFENLIVGAF